MSQPDYARLRMVKDRYGEWSGVRVTDCGRFRVEKLSMADRDRFPQAARQVCSFARQPEYAVWDLIKPRTLDEMASIHANGAIVWRTVVIPNTATWRLCDIRDWIVERVESESAVDRLAQIMQQSPSMVDASADGS